MAMALRDTLGRADMTKAVLLWVGTVHKHVAIGFGEQKTLAGLKSQDVKGILLTRAQAAELLELLRPQVDALIDGEEEPIDVGAEITVEMFLDP